MWFLYGCDCLGFKPHTVAHWGFVNNTTGWDMILEKLTADKGLLLGICASGLMHASILPWQQVVAVSSNNIGLKRTRILDLRNAIDTAASHSDVEHFGLQCSRHINSSALGIAGQAMLHANTTPRALQIYRDYISLLIDHVNVEFREVGSVYELTLIYPPLTENWDQFLDFDAGLAIRMLQKCLGSDWTPAYVSLQRSSPLSSTLHESIFGKRITFGSRSTVIAITKESVPHNPDQEKLVTDLIESQCAIELRKLRNSIPLRDRVELELLRRIPQENLSIVSLSTHFNMSIRNFQRRLTMECTTFESLIETTRKELSNHFLRDENIAISRISDLLGYSSPNAYSRAAKQWYHMPPSEQRVALKY